MFQALFNSLSGLFSFSRALNTVSNNVANMNTPGFRGSDSFFSNINGGHGVRIEGEGLRTTPGDTRQTGNATDLAVDGQGYFVLRDPEGDLHFTRAGQFRFNEEGLLVDSVNGYEVMAIDNGSGLTTIDFDGYRSLPAVATTGVHMSGQLVSSSPVGPLNNVTVYDAAGNAHTLSVSMTKNPDPTGGTGTTWAVVIKDGTVDVGTGTIAFDGQGRPMPGSNTLTAVLTGGATPQSITFDFGTPGQTNGVQILGSTGTPGTNTPIAHVDDGHAVLGLNDMRFDDEGVLQFLYAQNERRSGPQIALAIFPNESALHLEGGRLISGAVAVDREIGRPGKGQFGRIAGGSLEMSNVDLTQEFAEMIIIQRGYQASSRVMTVSNEMLEQLYNSTRGS